MFEELFGISPKCVSIFRSLALSLQNNNNTKKRTNDSFIMRQI